MGEPESSLDRIALIKNHCSDPENQSSVMYQCTHCNEYYCKIEDLEFHISKITNEIESESQQNCNDEMHEHRNIYASKSQSELDESLYLKQYQNFLYKQPQENSLSVYDFNEIDEHETITEEKSNKAPTKIVSKIGVKECHMVSSSAKAFTMRWRKIWRRRELCEDSYNLKCPCSFNSNKINLMQDHIRDCKFRKKFEDRAKDLSKALQKVENVTEIDENIEIINLKKEPMYICKCGSRFQSKEMLDVHNSSSHLKLKPSCPFCSFTSIRDNEEKGVIWHMRRRHKKQLHQFQCKICQAVFDKMKSITKHLKAVHYIANDKNILDYKVVSSDVIKQNIRQRCAKGEYKCLHCDVTFISKQLLMLHEEYFHESQSRFTKIMNPSNLSSCSQCGFHVISKNPYKNLYQHVSQVHENMKLFQCQLCNTFFGSTQNDVINHIECVHKLKAEQKDVKSIKNEQHLNSNVLDDYDTESNECCLVCNKNNCSSMDELKEMDALINNHPGEKKFNSIKQQCLSYYEAISKQNYKNISEAISNSNLFDTNQLIRKVETKEEIDCKSDDDDVSNCYRLGEGYLANTDSNSDEGLLDEDIASNTVSERPERETELSSRGEKSLFKATIFIPTSCLENIEPALFHCTTNETSKKEWMSE